MRHRLVVFSALMLMATSLAPAFSAPADRGSAQFIASLGDQALQVIRSNTDPRQKLTYFHEMLDRDFDMVGISHFVLGPYWRRASDHERREFVRLLSDDLVQFYRRRFTQYEGETFQVTGSRADPAGVIVTSQILRPNGPPIEVDWRLRERGGVYKISDVIIGGVSMAVTERQTFAEQIERSGGQVAGLLAEMRR